MEKIDWIRMAEYQQQLYEFSRSLLSHEQKKTLTSAEREILSRIYLYPNENTPILLSKSSKMKKEAISRLLKGLYEKKCIEKQNNIDDERSYKIIITDIGLAELKKDYDLLLQPFYNLRKKMGGDFELLFELICKANNIIE